MMHLASHARQAPVGVRLVNEVVIVLILGFGGAIS